MKACSTRVRREYNGGAGKGQSVHKDDCCHDEVHLKDDWSAEADSRLTTERAEEGSFRVHSQAAANPERELRQRTVIPRLTFRWSAVAWSRPSDLSAAPNTLTCDHAHVSAAYAHL